jgi:hypothetical protein
LHAAAMRRGRAGPSAAPAPVSHSQQSDAVVLLPSLDDSEAPNNMSSTVIVSFVTASVVAASVVAASVVASVEASVAASVGVVATDVLGQHAGLQSLVKEQYFNTKTSSITED